MINEDLTQKRVAMVLDEITKVVHRMRTEKGITIIEIIAALQIALHTLLGALYEKARLLDKLTRYPIGRGG
ncbi:hypothetical protein DRO54_06675 [Candidatus Bathyarchaeota archaeon]|nr:MAG: hypothetical protein DRO54_06675 [Candidatus Bathyarchaeota archaeon]